MQDFHSTLPFFARFVSSHDGAYAIQKTLLREQVLYANVLGIKASSGHNSNREHRTHTGVDGAR